MSDFRDFINKGFPVDAQLGRLKGTTYTEWEPLLQSIRRGSVVRVLRPSYLAPAKGQTAKRRRVWTERFEAASAAGAKVISVDPELAGSKLAMRAYEEIGNLARGKRGVSKKGRPPKELNATEWNIVRRHWPVRKGWKVQEAVDEINRLLAPRVITRGWLYALLKQKDWETK